MFECQNCKDDWWVCENHIDKPWDGVSSHEDACGCGAGAPCPVCNGPDHNNGGHPRIKMAEVICSIYDAGELPDFIRIVPSEAGDR